MVSLTEKQKLCIEKARPLSRGNFRSKRYRELYFRFCEDGYISSDDFASYVTNSKPSNVLRLNKSKETQDRFNWFLDICEKQILGKDAIYRTNGENNVRNN